MGYNSAIRGLFRDLRRHLDRAWAQHTGLDPFAGDVWQVALLDLQSNPSRRWPATTGVIDFRPIQPAWLREVVKDWARTTRPYVQRLRETLRAARAASTTLAAAGRLEATDLGAGDFTQIIDAIRDQRRPDGTLYSPAHRNLLLYQLLQVIEHGRAAGLMAHVPDTFRPVRRQVRVRAEPNEDELGKALPDTVIRQLDTHLALLGPAGRAGSITAADLQAMQQAIYRILRDTGRRPGEVVSLRMACLEVIDGQHNLIYDNHKAARMRRRLPITADTAEPCSGGNAAHIWTPHRRNATGCSPARCCAPNSPTATSPPQPWAARGGPGSPRSALSRATCSARTGTPPRSMRPWSLPTPCATPTPNATPTPEYPSTCSRSSWIMSRWPPRWATTRSA